MPTTANEKPNSRELTGETGSWQYTIKGTSDPAAAKTAMLADADATFNGLARDDARSGVKPVFVDSTNADVCIWEGTVHYGKRPGPGGSFPAKEQLTIGQVAVTFDMSGGTEHITYSKQTVQKKVAVGNASDYKNAIGVLKTGHVEGVDIEVPSIAYTIRKVYSAAGLPSVSTLQSIVKTYNNATVTFTDSRNGRQFSAAAGEAFMRNISGPTATPDGGWELTFEVLFQANVTGEQIGDITGIDKLGHHYLWIVFKETEDATGKKIVTVPQQVNVERVYDPANWSGL